jgi:hypothetical protein
MVVARAPETVLRHPCRAAIQAVVQESPGIHFLGLVRSVGSPAGPVRPLVCMASNSVDAPPGRHWKSWRFSPDNGRRSVNREPADLFRTSST